MTTKPAPGTAQMDPSGAPVCRLGCPREPGRVCDAWVKPAPDAVWENVGSPELVTLTPSYNCARGCGWHGYVVDGRLVDNPSIPHAAASISTLRVCESCQHPEVMTVGLTPTTEGMKVEFKATRVRQP